MIGKLKEIFREREINRKTTSDIRARHRAKDYRPTVVAAVRNKYGEFVVVKHPSGSRFFPQGGIGEGEPLTQALRRELDEEVGNGRVRGLELLFTQKIPYLPGRPQRDGFKVGKEYFVCLGESNGISSLYYNPGELSGAEWADGQKLEEMCQTMEPEKAGLVLAVLSHFRKAGEG